MSDALTAFASLDDVSTHLRETLGNKKYILLFAYNGTGKTCLSMEFKDVGRNGDERDTLYFNAFTEDLFSWDNDLDNNAQRVLRINRDSRFFNGLQELEMESRIRPLLQRYGDFDFVIDYAEWTVNFTREVPKDGTTEKVEHIKVSRGEENIFIWCFFLAIAQLAVDASEEGEVYFWVKYLYIDDPISSLDDNNAIAVASHLAQLLKNQNRIKTVISSHHTLFFNVMCNELKKSVRYMLCKHDSQAQYTLTDTKDTPYFHHVATLKDLYISAEKGELYTYHFNILRNILEKTAAFHGFNNFSACIKQDDDDTEGILHTRMINILSHGNYSLFEPMKMIPENKQYFKKILSDFMTNYRFNPELFPEQIEETN
jgi:wobble nucleotide-excising tRNase